MFSNSTKLQVIKKGLVLMTAFAFMIACKKNPGTANGHNPTTVDCSGAAKSFSTDVKPIIQASCATNSGCHGAGSNNGPGALTSYSEIFDARAGIRSAVISGAMPKNGSLTTTQKNSIICWIDNGALNN